MGEELIIRGVLMVPVLALFWVVMLHYWSPNRKKAVESLRRHFEGEVYPGEELSSVLQSVETEKQRKLQLRDLAGVRITPEQEKSAAYFARTSQLVCDGRRKGEAADSWYQEAEWIRDIVAGKPIRRGKMKPIGRKRR